MVPRFHEPLALKTAGIELDVVPRQLIHLIQQTAVGFRQVCGILDERLDKPGLARFILHLPCIASDEFTAMVSYG